jgi:dihydroorotate dehydrogenase
MAAGFDKDVRVAIGLAALGFGHIEVGTLTPRPQAGNPRPRIFRLPEDSAIINRMGFPNGGVAAAVPRLRLLAAQPHDFVLGVSLGKQKETPLAEAASDYIGVMQAVYPFADYLAVNISSPNTPGLRELQGGNYLGQLLSLLTAESKILAQTQNVSRRPLFVKIAPDLTLAELDKILTAVQDSQIDAIIATNTTISRYGLTSAKQNEAGGLSGLPLRQQSTKIIQHVYRQTNGRLPIIGVGGIRTADNVQAKLDAGASLVQLYTSLVYEGPGLPGRLLRALTPSSTN